MSLVDQVLGRMPMSTERAVFLFGVIGGVALTSSQFLFSMMIEERDEVNIREMAVAIGFILVANLIAPTFV